jgi:hypothetical protein
VIRYDRYYGDDGDQERSVARHQFFSSSLEVNRKRSLKKLASESAFLVPDVT